MLIQAMAASVPTQPTLDSWTQTGKLMTKARLHEFPCFYSASLYAGTLLEPARFTCKLNI